MELTKRYACMALGFNVNADFSEMSRFFQRNERRIKFIKSTPLFFAHPDDQLKHPDMLGNDLKMWLMQCDESYYVFLNCGIKRYNNYLSVLDAYSDVLYDFSYPVLRKFETEEEALEFYDRLSTMFQDTTIGESITKKFNAQYFTEARESDVNLGRVVETFQRVIYQFNVSQKFAIVLQKHNGERFESNSIIVNKNIRISFETEKDRNACWDFLVNFYSQFKEKKVSGISDQLFLTDFLMELMQNADDINKLETKERQVIRLECRFRGYRITFRTITRNGSYWGKDFEFRSYYIGDGIGIGERVERYKIEYLKDYLKKTFPDEEFMQKYINC